MDLAEGADQARFHPKEPGAGRRLMSSSVSEDSPWPLMRSLALRPCFFLSGSSLVVLKDR